jgi:lysyl-tRNA synthetase class I
MIDNVYNLVSMQRTQVYLPQSQLDWLKAKAKKENISMAALIRKAIEYYQRWQKHSFRHGHSQETTYVPQNSSQFLLMLADQAQSQAEQGPPDLAKNIDQYLYQGKEREEPEED